MLEVAIPSLPSDELRFKVHGSTEVADFLRVGRILKGNIEDAVKTSGRNWSELKSVLDFGCGPARVLRHFDLDKSGPVFFGTDYDWEAVHWCQAAMPRIQFLNNLALPPLAYESECFDLIWSISVFTHLSEDYFRAWMRELHRVLAPRGLLMLSFFGPGTPEWRDLLSAAERSQLESGGFLHKRRGDWAGIFPDWYDFSAFSSQTVREMFSEQFEIRAYLPQGINRHQDLLVLEKN